MKFRRIRAVLKKQIMDTVNNRGILFRFLIYPVIALLMMIVLPKDATLRISTVITISSMFVAMIPIMTIGGIVSEDKYTGSLRMLILSTVKPIEYFIGLTSYMILISIISCVMLGLIAGFVGIELLYFIGILLLGICATLLLGSVIAIKSPARVGLSNAIIIVSIVNGFIPMIGSLNSTINTITKYWYMTQVQNLLGDLSGNYYGNVPSRLIIIISNAILFLILFIVFFKNNRFINKD